MHVDFSSIHNHREREVFAEVLDRMAQHPLLAGNAELLADVACVALNRLPPQYIRHDTDFAFHRSDRERLDSQRRVGEAVSFAFDYVQARTTMKARA